MNNTDKVYMKMIQFDAGSPSRIQHFLKVHEFARLIAVGEGVDDDLLERIEVTTIMHDIGIKPSYEKYGNSDGKHQEELGPGYARPMLEEMGCYDEAFIDRVCYLIGHHHTYDNIQGLDYQILVEADFLVNLFENQMCDEAHREHLEKVRERIFRTKTGTEIFNTMFEL